MYVPHALFRICTYSTIVLAYMGMPLQVFGPSSFFSPYTPLQLLDLLMSISTHSFVVGSTNNLLLSQKDRYADILVNLEEEALGSKIQIINPALRNALSLSAADRRWMDNITQTVLDTWDPSNPSRPTTHGYNGSEDAIRLQFEEYILSLCSSAAYKTYFDSFPSNPTSSYNGSNSSSTLTHSANSYPDPLETGNDFNNDFLSLWRQTPNFALFDKLTRDASIFDIIPPKHPTAGGLNIEDVQRRLAQGVAELHLDDRVREGRETVGRYLGEGRERVGAGVARFWKEVETFRERREGSRTRVGDEKSQQQQPQQPQTSTSSLSLPSSSSKHKSSNAKTDPSQLADNITGVNTSTSPPSSNTSTSTSAAATATATAWLNTVRDRASKVQIPPRPEINTAQLSTAARDNAAKAGAYLSSWGSWARERGKEWSETRNAGGADNGPGAGSGSGK